MAPSEGTVMINLAVIEGIGSLWFDLSMGHQCFQIGGFRATSGEAERK